MNNDFRQLINKYAETIVSVGINLQKGELVVINSDIQNAELVRALTEKSYLNGASRVIVLWRDEKTSALNYKFATSESLSNLFDWEIQSKNFVADKKACYVNISSSDPDLLKHVDSDKIAEVSRATSDYYAKFYQASSRNDFKWCIVPGASTAWAKKVTEETDDDLAVAKLWSLIFKVNQIDCDNPVEAWKKHTDDLHERCKKLNELRLTKLIYKNSLGTDLTVDLPENYVFLGGSELSQDKCEFIANMPTEEVFSVPHKYGVNGKLVASLPLVLDGKLVRNFGFVFQNGKVVDYYAEEGRDVLTNLLAVDRGSAYLGEVALVPFDSPINNTETLFYNTLLDENARCHFALGFAYPQCVENGENMTEEQRESVGVNYSVSHVDFMVGTSDLSVVGITKSGEKIDIFVNGNFAI